MHIADGNLKDKADLYAEMRLYRQDILYRQTKPTIYSVLDESIFHRQIGSDTLRNEQISKIHEINDKDHVQIKILPYSSRGYRAFGKPFQLLEFDNAEPIIQMDQSFVIMKPPTTKEDIDKFKQYSEELLKISIPFTEFWESFNIRK